MEYYIFRECTFLFQNKIKVNSVQSKISKVVLVMLMQAGKYLTFILDDEDYGIPINKVREIIGIMEFTHVPKMPEYIKGVINLRGKIISIMDLRQRFIMPDLEYNDRTCIIVVEYETHLGKRQSGLIVDTVSEVLYISEDNIEQANDKAMNTEDECICGIGKVKEKVVMLLEVEKLLFENELTKV